MAENNVNNYTIAETFELPSKGLVYDKAVNATCKLRSMTTEDEMKRLTVSETPYKILSDLIEDCLVEKPGIPVYDMCLGDYQFLLQKLRIVTYGPDYSMTLRCSKCNEVFDANCNLDELQYNIYDEEFENMRVITLPRSGKLIELKFQTPRVLDDIARRKKDIMKKNPSVQNPEYLLTLMSFIKSVDGVKLNAVQLESFARKMPLQDANFVVQKGIEFTDKVGLNTSFNATCKHCGHEMESTFWVTPEFFRPTVH